jgi:hypothetical protein
MARADLQQLYQGLKSSRVRFLPRGEHDVRAIYRIVKARYPRLCDDRFLCSQNCSRGHEQPEWPHVVRKALQVLKSPRGPVSSGGAWGYWLKH